MDRKIAEMKGKAVSEKEFIQALYQRAEERYRTLTVKDALYKTEEIRDILAGREKIVEFDRELYKKLIRKIYLCKSHMVEERPKEIVWRCSNRLTNGVKKCPNSETIKEEALNRAVMEAIHRITCDDREFIETFRQNVISVINTKEALQEENDYDTLLKNKQEEMLALIMENAKAGEYTQEFDARYHAIAEEIQSIKENQTEARKREETLRECNQRMYEIDDFLRTTTCRIPEFDNDL